jgi:hypothetical protein
MKTILDLPKYLDSYNNILLVNHSTKKIKDLFPTHTFSKITIDGITNIDQLDRQLKLDLLLSDNKLYLIEHIYQLTSYPFSYNFNGTFKHYDNSLEYYNCIFDNFKNSDAKLVNLSQGDPNRYLVKNSQFIAKINKNSSITVIKNKFNYYINNW